MALEGKGILVRPGGSKVPPGVVLVYTWRNSKDVLGLCSPRANVVGCGENDLGFMAP